jgi:YD repeat-containing protein
VAIPRPGAAAVNIAYSGGQPFQISPYRSSLVQTVSGSNPVTIQIADGLFATYTFDANGHLTSFQTNQGTTAITTDSTGNVLSRTEPNGSKTSYTYNSKNRVLTTTTAEGTTTQGYDGTGSNLASITRPAGDKSVFTRDASYNITKHEEFKAGGSTATLSVTYTRNTAGLTTAVTPTMGDTYGFDYDVNGFTNKVLRNSVEVQTITNNSVGLPTQIVDHPANTPDLTTTLGYDPRGRLTSHSTAAGDYACGYDPAGKVTTQSFSPSDTTPQTSSLWSYTNRDPTSLGQGQNGDTPTTNTFGYQ